MNVAEKVGTGSNSQAVDVDRFRLRRYIEELVGHRRTGNPATTRSIWPASPKCWRAIPRPCCFAPPGRKSAELVGNVMGGRARLAAAFGVKPSDLLEEIQRRLRNKPDIIEVSRAQAPCQEVVLTGDDADLTKLPVHLQHGADGGPYISASIDYVIDPKTGWTNVGLRRLMLRSAKESRHRSGGAKRSEGDLRGQCGGRKAHAGELRGRRAPDRPRRRHHAAAGR